MRTIISLCAIVSLIFLGTPASASAQEVPAKLLDCLTNGLIELARAETVEQKRRVFNRYTDHEELGSALYRDRTRGWHTFSPEEKRVGVSLFFSRIVALSKHSSNDLDRTLLRLGSAELRRVYETAINGKSQRVYQIAVRLTDGNKDTVFTVRVLWSCTVIDVMQGNSLARTLSDDDVRSYLRKHGS